MGDEGGLVLRKAVRMNAKQRLIHGLLCHQYEHRPGL